MKDSQGFGLVGALMATTLMSIVAVGLASAFKNSFALQSNLKFRSQSDAFLEEVRAVLSSEAACTNTLQGLPLTPSTTRNVDDVKTAAGVPIYNKTTTYGDNSFEIKRIQLKDYVHDVGSTGRATLAFTLQKTGEQNGGPSEIQRTLSLRTERNAANNLVACLSLAKMADGLWSRVPSSISDIYFAPSADTKVGIGTDAPTAALDIVGNANPTELKVSGSGDVFLNLGSSRNGVVGPVLTSDRTRGNLSTATPVQQGDQLLSVNPRGFTGTSRQASSKLDFVVDGPVSANDVPSSIVFSTGTRSAPASNVAERMRISSAGNVGIGTVGEPQAKLDVKGGTIRGRFECRRVQGNWNLAPSQALCAADEWVMSGGGECQSIATGSMTGSGFLHESRPLPDLSGWVTDCFRQDWASEGIASRAYAVCCKQ